MYLWERNIYINVFNFFFPSKKILFNAWLVKFKEHNIKRHIYKGKRNTKTKQKWAASDSNNILSKLHFPIILKTVKSGYLYFNHEAESNFFILYF